MYEINVTGYNAATEEKPLNLGTAASYGMEKLHITFDAAWDDLSKSATFNCGKPGRGLRPVTRMIDEDGIVDVPQEATAVATKDGTITLLGVAPGSGQRISVDIPYTVTGHAAVPGQTAEDKPSAFEQILEAAQGAERAAQKAQEAAGTAKDEAQAGAEAASKWAAASAQAAEKSAAQAEASASEAQGHSAQAGQYAQQTADAVALGQQAAGDARTDRLAAESAQQEATKHEQAAKDAATDAGTAKTAAEGSATAAAESAELAKQQADAAVKFAILAQSAADTATEAKADAMDAQTAAEDAQDKALTAQTCAETAQGKAEDAAKTATGAADRAEEAAAQVQPIDDAAITTTSPWSSKQIIDLLCPPLEETGNPVQCHPVAGYPLGVIVSWEPTQAGSGTPSPDNIRPISGRDAVKVERCGENLLNPDKILYNTYKPYGLTINYIGDNKVMLKGTYSTDGGSFAIAMLSDTALSGRGYKITAFGDTKKLSFYGLRTKDEAAIAAQCSFVTGEIIDRTIQLFIYAGTIPPATYTPYVGTSHTLTLPRTICGGEVDAQTGEGQETWKLLTLDGTEHWNSRTTIKSNGYISYSMALPQRSLTGICSHYKSLTYAAIRPTSPTGEIGSYLEYSMSAIFNVQFETQADWKDFLAAQYAAGTPVQIAYKLVSPIPFTATGGAEIKALAGTNTLMTDGDTVTVTGREDIVHAISELRTAKATDVEG